MRVKIVTEPNLGPPACHASKPISWHQVVVKESTAFIAGTSKVDGQLMLKRPKLPVGFKGRVFKGNIKGEACRVHDKLVDFF